MHNYEPHYQALALMAALEEHSKGAKESKAHKSKSESTKRSAKKNKKIKNRHYIRNADPEYSKGKRKVTNQLKQLINQKLRFMRAASSPAARIAQM